MEYRICQNKYGRYKLQHLKKPLKIAGVTLRKGHWANGIKVVLGRYHGCWCEYDTYKSVEEAKELLIDIICYLKQMPHHTNSNQNIK